jgi:hypothetical protein
MSMNYKAFFIDPITPLSTREVDRYQLRLTQVEASQIRAYSEGFKRGAYSEWKFNQRAASQEKKEKGSLDLWKRYLNLL